MCWHKWTNWKQYEYRAPAPQLIEGFAMPNPSNAAARMVYVEWRQTRACVKCNRREDEPVRRGHAPEGAL